MFTVGEKMQIPFLNTFSNGLFYDLSLDQKPFWYKGVRPIPQKPNQRKVRKTKRQSCRY